MLSEHERRHYLRQTGIAQHEQTQPPDAVLMRLHQHPERLPPSSQDGGNRVSFGIGTFGHASLYKPGRQMVPGFRKKHESAPSDRATRNGTGLLD